ncbi:hypothetical protein Pdw03_4905 [Penicillium digitatum]|uniref:Uncharacterized protein n=1 Tax=Penicillium digitatum TaxID=36651 RepID=A0A7T7BJP5_PENDI|nr:hypothetical protein Pdw03_4905 [Penicillium digitatum]
MGIVLTAPSFASAPPPVSTSRPLQLLLPKIKRSDSLALPRSHCALLGHSLRHNAARSAQFVRNFIYVHLPALITFRMIPSVFPSFHSEEESGFSFHSTLSLPRLSRSHDAQILHFRSKDRHSTNDDRRGLSAHGSDYPRT